MSKYDYEGIGYRRSYEDYVRIMQTGEGLPIPTKEDIDAEFGEGAWKTNEEVVKLTEKINKLRTELKGENTHA